MELMVYWAVNRKDNHKIWQVSCSHFFFYFPSRTKYLSLYLCVCSTTSSLSDLTSMGLLLTTTNMMLLVSVALRTPKSRRFSFWLGGRTSGCLGNRETHTTLHRHTLTKRDTNSALQKVKRSDYIFGQTLVRTECDFLIIALPHGKERRRENTVSTHYYRRESKAETCHLIYTSHNDYMSFLTWIMSIA